MTHRIERIGDAELHLADCRELRFIADAVISDPPYGVSERTDRKSKGRGALAECNDFPPVFGDNAPFDPSRWLQFPKVVLFGGNHFCSRLPDASCWLIWDKRDGVPSNDNADCEIAWTNLGGPARNIRHLWNGMIKASERSDRRVHPTQKPVAVMEWVIDQCKLQRGAAILDPYMGSGSTGVAAIRKGFRFIGCEIEPAYFETACKRIEEATKQGDLIRDVLPKPEQKAMEL
jgi:site-specific DNA-methyltransferase (adenine-specific)